MFGDLLLRMSCSSVLGIECGYELKNEVYSRKYFSGTHIHNVAFDTFYYSVPISIGDLTSHAYAFIEECSFYNCYNANGAGCISFVTVSGQLNISKVCANRCCVGTGYGQFLYCYIQDHMMAFINISIILNCAPPNTGSSEKFAALCVKEGTGHFSNINVSECNSQSETIAYFYSNPNVVFNFAHFIRNMPVSSNAFRFYSTKLIVTYSNIIANSAPNGCIFYGNSQEGVFSNCVFYNNYNALFHYWSKITIDNCYMFHSGTTTSNVGTILYINASTSFAVTNTIELQRYSTHRCYDQQYSVNELGEPCQTIPPNPSTCNTLSIQDLKVFDIVSNIFALFPLVFY